MSILIKGIDMPTEGTVFVIDSAGQVWSNEWPTRGYIRLDGVTAVPVSSKLIDALCELYNGEISYKDTMEGLD